MSTEPFSSPPGSSSLSSLSGLSASSGSDGSGSGSGSGSRPSTAGTLSTSSSPRSGRITLDSSAFPHILSAIIDASSHSTLLAFRATSRSLCETIDTHLGQHLILEQIQAVYPTDDRSRRGDVRWAVDDDEGMGRLGRTGGSGGYSTQDMDGDESMDEGDDPDDEQDESEPLHRSVAAISEIPRPQFAILISDPEGNRVPALPSGQYSNLTPRQASAFGLAKVVTFRGLATPYAFSAVIPYITARTLLYRVRGYAGPLPRSRVVVPIPPQPPQITPRLARWSLGPARCDTLVLLVPLSHMGVGFVLHANSHRDVITILMPQEVSLAALGFSPSEVPTIVSPTTGPPSPSPPASNMPSAPSSPVPWARPPAAPTFAQLQNTPPQSPLRHIVRNIARTIGHTRHTIVGLELVDSHTTSHTEDLKRHVIHSVLQQAWRGDWYGPGDEMERSVRDRIEFISHIEYERRVGEQQYLLETTL